MEEENSQQTEASNSPCWFRLCSPLPTVLTEFLSSLQVWTIHLLLPSFDELDFGWKGNGLRSAPLSMSALHFYRNTHAIPSRQSHEIKWDDGCACSQYSATPVTVLRDENLSFLALSSRVSSAFGDWFSFFGHKSSTAWRGGVAKKAVQNLDIPGILYSTWDYGMGSLGINAEKGPKSSWGAPELPYPYLGQRCSFYPDPIPRKRSSVEAKLALSDMNESFTQKLCHEEFCFFFNFFWPL